MILNISNDGQFVCTPFSVNVFVTLTTQQHFEYYCKVLFEMPCIWQSSIGLEVKIC
jgi:hypothetical protein